MGTGNNPQVSPPPRYRFGIYEADVRAGELTRDGVKVKLQEQPFQVLLTMLERPGEIVTREDLRQRLWPADTFVDFDHSLNTAILKLREALRDTADNPRFIETKPRRGYRFIAPVQVVGAEPTPAASVPEVPSAVTASTIQQPVAESELPQVHRGWTRLLFGLIQLMYLCFYVIALVRLWKIEEIADRAGLGWMLIAAVIVTATLGIPIRLYLGTAIAFDYKKTGAKFLRLFPFIVVLDIIWALSPFLSTEVIGIGLAFAVTAALLYLPFSQRTLIRMTYPS